MKNNRVIVLIVLGIAAVASLIYGLTTTPKKRSADEPSETAVKKIIPAERRTKRTEYATWGRNPFLPKAETEASKLILDGIMWDEKNPKAMVNNTVVGIGAKLCDKTVTDIKRDCVILKDKTGEIILKLGE